MTKNNENNKNKSIHVFVLLFLLVLLASILTYVIPSGEFKRAKDEKSGQTIVLADSYHEVDKKTVEPWNIPAKFYQAITSESTAKLIFFILIIGGSFEIIMQTQCLTILCEMLLLHLRDKKLLLIPIFVILFSVFGFTMGLSTASVIFVPIGIAAAKNVGYDTLTGTVMVALGTNAGFAAGIFNPFSVGVAQSIAEVPLYSGAWIRLLLLIVLVAATSVYIMYYAKKYAIIENDINNNNSKQIIINTKMTSRQKLVLLEFFISFCVLTYGVSFLEFSMQDISVVFLIMGTVSGLTAGFGINQVCDIFINGSKKMIKGVFVIGIAATIRLVLTDGKILDTITYNLTDIIYYYPKWAQLLGMFYSNAAIDLVITSGSAHAAITMPIMTPMADFLHLSRQSAVFAFQLGDGLVNLTSPISTTLTGVLAVSEISYSKWAKYFFPLVGVYLVIGTAFIVLAGLTCY